MQKFWIYFLSFYTLQNNALYENIQLRGISTNLSGKMIIAGEEQGIFGHLVLANLSHRIEESQNSQASVFNASESQDSKMHDNIVKNYTSEKISEENSSERNKASQMNNRTTKYTSEKSPVANLDMNYSTPNQIENKVEIDVPAIQISHESTQDSVANSSVSTENGQALENATEQKVRNNQNDILHETELQNPIEQAAPAVLDNILIIYEYLMSSLNWLNEYCQNAQNNSPKFIEILETITQDLSLLKKLDIKNINNSKILMEFREYCEILDKVMNHLSQNGNEINPQALEDLKIVLMELRNKLTISKIRATTLDSKNNKEKNADINKFTELFTENSSKEEIVNPLLMYVDMQIKKLNIKSKSNNLDENDHIEIVSVERDSMNVTPNSRDNNIVRSGSELLGNLNKGGEAEERANVESIRKTKRQNNLNYLSKLNEEREKLYQIVSENFNEEIIAYASNNIELLDFYIITQNAKRSLESFVRNIEESVMYVLGVKKMSEDQMPIFALKKLLLVVLRECYSKFENPINIDVKSFVKISHDSLSEFIKNPESISLAEKKNRKSLSLSQDFAQSPHQSFYQTSPLIDRNLKYANKNNKIHENVYHNAAEQIPQNIRQDNYNNDPARLEILAQLDPEQGRKEVASLEEKRRQMMLAILGRHPQNIPNNHKSGAAEQGTSSDVISVVGRGIDQNLKPKPICLDGVSHLISNNSDLSSVQMMEKHDELELVKRKNIDQSSSLDLSYVGRGIDANLKPKTICLDHVSNLISNNSDLSSRK